MQLRDGSSERGYLIDERAGLDGSVIVQVGPEQQKIIPAAALAEVFYPNNMTLLARVRLALKRLQQRTALTQTPSPD